MMKNVFLLSLLLLFAGVKAQQRILQFGNDNIITAKSPVRTVNDKGINGISVNYHFSSAGVFTVNEKDIPKKYQGKFSMINIPGFSHLQDAGMPALPAHIEIIAVPKGAAYSLEIKSVTKLKHQGYKIYPARKPAVDTEGDHGPAFEIDNDFYKSDKIFPQQPVKIVETYDIRGMKFLLVQITPVQYNPAKSEIYTISDLKYEIKFNGASRFFDYENHTREFMNVVLDYPLNSKGFKGDYQNYLSGNNGSGLMSSSQAKNYIIIVQNSMLAAADSLAHWKRQLGYKVEVVSAATWTAANVKNAIHSRYQAWTPRPDYFVIIGDVQQVPAELFTSPDGNGTYGTDLYYACMGGSADYVPEMAHGRISVSSASEALMVVGKIIKYERNPVADSTYYQNGVNCAQYQDDNLDGYADRRFLHTSEEVRNYVMGRGYNVQRIYYAASNVTPVYYNASYYSNGQSLPSALGPNSGFNWNGGANDIKNAINAGKFYVLHRDHGYAGGYGWAHPYFVNSKIGQLTNGDKQPVVFSINCHTGEFTLSSCFAETFLRKSNGGAVGVVAASYYSYSGYNDGFSVGMFDGIWSNPGLVPNFGNGGNSNPQVTPHSDIVNMGFVLNHGLLRMTQTWGGNGSGRKYTHRLFHYFGDPAMRIWTEQPDSITATHAWTLTCSDTAFAITGCSDSNAVATLMNGNTLLGSSAIINGSGTVHPDYVIGNTLTLTISARNKVPYIRNITVLSGSNMALSAVITNNKCYGDSIGSIEVTPSCGQPPYQIVWSTGDTTNRIDSLPGGNYIITITDNASSSLTDTITVWAPVAPLQSSPVVSDAKCYFESSGSIALNLSGGATPYTYHWSHGQSSAIATNLSAGNYSVNVIDSAGCTFSQSFVINQPQPLDLQTTYTDDSLNNCTGTGTAIASGGTPPYTYQWNDPANQTTVVATGLCKGIYKVTLKDSNLCTQYRTIFVNNTVGINENNKDSKYKVFPNPARRKINIGIEEPGNGNLTVVLRDDNGKVVLRKVIAANAAGVEFSLDISALASGIYFLSVDNDSKRLITSNVIIDGK